ncbi:hypothetical protein [Streptomyces buecherae]|uniref:hypothetical protein n=1 Tax=Streptomyces buecherae TaxID=2763006 RepID=UPI00365E6F9D
MAATPDTTTLADRTTPAGLTSSSVSPYASLAPSTPSPKADRYARPSRTTPYAGR